MNKEQKVCAIHCKVCSKEIPKSAAVTGEGKDYAWHFCGKDCYQKWKNSEKK